MSKIENLTIKEGDTGDILCKFSSNPLVEKVSWYKNDSEIFPDDHFLIENNDSSSKLIIRNIDFTDNGSIFTARIKNLYGEIISNKSVVNVLSGPRFIQEPKDLKVLLEKEARFECSIISNPSPSITWFLNEKELNVKDGVRIEKNQAKNLQTLTFPRVSVLDSGVITVKALNEVGTAERTCLLEITQAPKILNKLTNITINEGEDIQFSIQYSGNPKPNPKWFKDEIEIQSDYFEILEKENESVLKIKKCESKKNSGTYFVKISNEFGESSSNKAILTINSKFFTK